MNAKRFRSLKCAGHIVDNMTGKAYPVNILHIEEIVDLLNRVNNRGDRNAEKYCKARYERDVIKMFYDEYGKVLDKYRIDSPQKLDKILFYARTW